MEVSTDIDKPLLERQFHVEQGDILVTVRALNVVVPPERVDFGVQTEEPEKQEPDAAENSGTPSLSPRSVSSNGNETVDILNESVRSQISEPATSESNVLICEEIMAVENGDVTPTAAENASVDAQDRLNPLLAFDDTESDHTDYIDKMSAVSEEEFRPVYGKLEDLDPDDPKTIMTWNSSGLDETMRRKALWSRFVAIVQAVNPDIVVLQNVKLSESEIIGMPNMYLFHANLGLCPKVMEKGDGRAVPLSYEQKLRDATLIDNLNRDVFKHYRLIHSLASWKMGGQLVFIKKRYTCLTQRFCLNMKLHPKYHHPEGRSVVIQFKSYYLICLTSPNNGWDKSNVAIRTRWFRELAHMLYELRDTKAAILCGNLNCAPEDIDLSNPVKLKMEHSPVLHDLEVTGYPGSRPADRESLKWIMLAGHLVDTFRYLHPYKKNEKDSKALQYTSLVYLGDKTRCAVRTNLTLISEYFLKNVAQCEIIGDASNLSPSGWRHLPQLLSLSSPNTGMNSD